MAMSRDVEDRRQRRRRLLVYRPSSNDCQTPCLQDRVTPPTSYGRTLPHNPCLHAIPPGGGINIHQPETPLRTNCSTNWGDKAHQGPPFQAPNSRPHREISQPGGQTPPSKSCGSRNEHLSCLLASPLERTANRILFVELHDVAREAGPFHAQSPPTDRKSVSGDCAVIGCPPSPADVQDVRPGPSATPPDPLPSGPSIHRPLATKSHTWGLVPLFQSVRSKLESFAEIFLSPMKSLQEAQVVEPPPHRVPPGEEDGPPDEESPAEDPPNSPLHTLSAQKASPPASNMNLQFKIEISSPVSTLCRPPLQRCLSCPLLAHRLRRQSLDTAEQKMFLCSCRAEISRQRRHSVGTVEEFRKLSPISLTCLRKEKHPSALWTTTRSLLQYGISSPPGPCLDVNGVGGTALRTGGVDTAGGSNPLSPCKETKEWKVSNIQIRKRVARQGGNLTPLGLPKRLRLQKSDFSLEEIYTNQNYHTPTEKRKFETIFEEPRMKGGSLILTSQRPLRRIMVFKDSSSPCRRRRKGRGGGRSRSSTHSKCANGNLELLLQHKLEELEAELQQEEGVELC